MGIVKIKKKEIKMKESKLKMSIMVSVEIDNVRKSERVKERERR